MARGKNRNDIQRKDGIIYNLSIYRFAYTTYRGRAQHCKMNAFLFVIAVIILFFLSTFISDYIDLPTFIKPKKKKSSSQSYLREQIAKIPFRCQSRFYSQDLFPGLKEIQEHWQSIREEASNAQKFAPAIESRDEEVDERYGWCKAQDVLMLENVLEYVLIIDDHIVTKNGGECPKTTEILSHIEGIHSAKFVWIKPHSHIYQHSNTIGLEYNSLAYHLGLSVKECQLSVDNITVQEEEGKVVIFDSTFAHNINNASDTGFMVLHIDFKLIGL